MTRRAILMIGLALCGAAILGPSASAAGARWVQTDNWEGTGPRTTDRFWVNGAKWRVRYEPRGRGPFRVEVFDADGTRLSVVTDQRGRDLLPGSGTVVGRGTVYLRVTAPGASWKLVVDQHVTTIEEWQLLELTRQNVPRFAKVGVWTGEAGDVTYGFRILRATWRLLFSRPMAKGVTVVVTDESGAEVLRVDDTCASAEFPVHRGGSFRMQVVAPPGVEWQAEVQESD